MVVKMASLIVTHERPTAPGIYWRRIVGSAPGTWALVQIYPCAVLGESEGRLMWKYINREPLSVLGGIWLDQCAPQNEWAGPIPTPENQEAGSDET